MTLSAVSRIAGDSTDAASISDIWLKSFTNDYFKKLFPRAASTMEWSIHMNSTEFSDPRARFLKITSDQTPADFKPSVQPENGKPAWGIDPSFVAFAKWQVPIDGKTILDNEWNADVGWPVLSPVEDCKYFFETLFKKRKEIMGDRPHYFLEVLATRPDFQRQGAGSKLIQWGLDKADEEGLECYIEASKYGLELYKRYGWEPVDSLTVQFGPREEDKDTTVMMVRKARPKKVKQSES